MNIKYMKLAYKEALKALKDDEVPVGAVIVKDGKVIAKAYNMKESKQCGVYHAEILAIMRACKKLSNWRLENCDIYITLAPCPMCASAIKQSRISNVYCGLSNSDSSVMNITKEILENNDKIEKNISGYRISGTLKVIEPAAVSVPVSKTQGD